MPWRVTSPMHQRQRFVLDAEHTPADFAEFCRRDGISRKTGYKWFDRYRPAPARQSRRSLPAGPSSVPMPPRPR